MASSLAQAAIIGTFLALGARGAEVTPIEKVLSLLGDLSSKIEEEGTAEAKQYDKFACFCKEQATEKMDAIEASKKKIARLTAEQTQLSAQIAALNSEDSNLKKKMSENKDQIKDKKKTRSKDHAEFLYEAKDIKDAIDACNGAIKTLEDALKQQKDEWHKDLDYKMKSKLLQVQSLVAKHPVAASLLAKITGPRQGGYDGTKAIMFQLKTFRGVLMSFKKSGDSTFQDESKAKSLAERAIAGNQQENKYSKKQVRGNEQVVNRRSADLEDSKTAKDQEIKNMAMDQQFLKEVTSECEEKAKLFDQRSKARAGELTALSQAVEALKKGKPPKGTVGVMAELQAPVNLLQVSAPQTALLDASGGESAARVDKATAIFEDAMNALSTSDKKMTKQVELASQPVAASFLQIRRQSGKEATIQRVRAFLANVVVKTNSIPLSTLAIRVQVAADHFGKVRGLIKDMIAKLKADASSEATQKSFCDKSMKKATEGRDTAKSKIEAASARVTTLSAKKSDLKEEIGELNKKTAELKKAMLEATELRQDEAKDNKRTINTSNEAITGVKMALSVLQSFYSKAAFVQYTPKNADRSGKTVGDRAPKVFQDKYRGAQAESKGIMGILEVCLSDFEGVKKKTQSEEMQAAKEFNKLEKDTKEDVSEKAKMMKTKSGMVADTQASLLDEMGAKKDATSLLKSSMKVLDSLQASCVAGSNGEDFKERKKARLAEIESLKEAMELLDSWKAD